MIDAGNLYNEVIEKFDVYHLGVAEKGNCYYRYRDRVVESFKKYFDDEHFKEVSLDNLATVIANIIIENQNGKDNEVAADTAFGEISW